MSRRPHDFARGAFVIVFDDESRENEGDLMVAAEHTDHIAMAYLLDHTAGVMCAAVPSDRCAELQLPQMVSANSGLHATAFTVSVDLRHGATTGIPAAERARTVQALADPATRPDDLARPGHVFPIRAALDGVLERSPRRWGRCSRLLAARAQPRADRARSGHDAMGRRPDGCQVGQSYCLGPGTSGMQFICVNAASGDRRAGSAMTVPDRWVPWLVERMRHAASGSNVLR